MILMHYGLAFQEGRIHSLHSLGYQDSHCCITSDNIFVGVVGDGCSSRGFDTNPLNEHSHSGIAVHSYNARRDGFTKNQVGAILGAEALGHTLYRYLRLYSVNKNLDFGLVLQKAVGDIIAYFNIMVEYMGTLAAIGNEASFWKKELFIVDKLMFSFLGVAIMDRKYWVFGIGDGCYGTNNDHFIIDTPTIPYINYKLLYPEAEYSTTIHKEGIIDNNSTLWIATDGLIPILENSYAKQDFISFINDSRTALEENGEDKTIQAFRSNIFRNKANAPLLSDDMTILVIKLDKCEIEPTSST